MTYVMSSRRWQRQPGGVGGEGSQAEDAARRMQPPADLSAGRGMGANLSFGKQDPRGTPPVRRGANDETLSVTVTLRRTLPSESSEPTGETMTPRKAEIDLRALACRRSACRKTVVAFSNQPGADSGGARTGGGTHRYSRFCMTLDERNCGSVPLHSLPPISTRRRPQTWLHMNRLLGIVPVNLLFWWCRQHTKTSGLCQNERTTAPETH